MSLFDALQSPQAILGLSLLNNPESIPGGLLQGIARNRQMQQQGLQQQLVQSQILKAQQDAEERKRQQAEQAALAGQFSDFFGTRPTEQAGPQQQGLQGTSLLGGGTGALADNVVDADEMRGFAGLLMQNPQTMQQGISLLNSLKQEEVKAQSPAGQIAADVQKGFITSDQGQRLIENSLKKPAGSTKMVTVMRNGIPTTLQVDNNGNVVADWGEAKPQTPLFSTEGLTKSHRSAAILNRSQLKQGRDIAQEILVEIESGAEPAGITRSIRGSLQSAADQLKTAADQVSSGAASSALNRVASAFNKANSMVNKDIAEGNLSKEMATELGFIGKPQAVTDLKRNLLTYMVARLNVGSGQKITNQMIQEAQQQTQIGGLGGGGRDIAIGRYKTLVDMFDEKISSQTELIEGQSSSAASQLEAVLKALSGE